MDWRRKKWTVIETDDFVTIEVFFEINVVARTLSIKTIENAFESE